MPARAHIFALLVILGATGYRGVALHAQSSTPISASKVIVQQWSAKDGLPVNGATSLHQDASGFLWISTLGGLARFDGNRFQVFETKTHPDLPNNRVQFISAVMGGMYLVQMAGGQVLLFDSHEFLNLNSTFGFASRSGWVERSDSLVWIFTDRGLLEVDRSGAGRYVSQMDTTVYGGISGQGGNTWMGTPNGLFTISAAGQETWYTTADGLPFNDVLGVLEGDGDTLFVATQRGLTRLSGRTFTPLEHRDRPGEPVSSGALFQFGDERLVATSRGWRRIVGNRLVRSFSHGVFPDSPVSPLAIQPVVDARGDLWYAHGATIYRNGTPVHNTGSQVLHMIPDRMDGIWAADNAHGVFRIVPTVVQVTSMREGLPGRNAYGLLEAQNGQMWVGLLDIHQFVRYDGERVTMRVDLDQPWAAGRGPDGHTWLGGSELCRVEGSQCTRQSEPPLPTPVRAIFTDSRGRLWIGTEDAVWVRRAESMTLNTSEAWHRIPHENGDRTWARAIVEGQDGEIHVATLGHGLGRVQNDTLRTWDRREGFPSDNIRSVFQLSRRELLVGSEDAGLIYLSWQAGATMDDANVQIIDRSHGLPDNSVHAIVEDEDGFLWMNSNRGIYRVDPEEIRQVALHQKDQIAHILFDDQSGLRNREGNGGIQSAGYRTVDGKIRFPTQDGVVTIDPSLARSTPLPVVIPLQYTTSDTYTFEAGDDITLEPNERTVQVSFSAPYFHRPTDLTYRYRLRGYDDAWIETGSEPAIVLTGVPAGSYTLEIQAGAHGTWSAWPTRLSITRKAGFTETPWFLLVLIGLGIGLASIATYGRMRLVQRRNRQLENIIEERTHTVRAQAERLATLDDMKTRFFANISHELRTPLTLIKGPITGILHSPDGHSDTDTRRRLDTVRRNVDRLSDLVEQILDLAALEAGTLDVRLQTGDLVEFMTRQTERFTHDGHERGIAVNLDAPDAPLLWTFDHQRLEHVMSNLIGNALKFTEADGRITIVLHAEGSDAVRIQVADTGMGISGSDLPYIFDRYYQGNTDNTSAGSGIGLAMTRELVELHGGTIGVESGPGVGSTFTVTLPRLSTEADEPAASVVSPEIRKQAPHLPLPTPEYLPSTGSVDRSTILVAEDNPDLLRFLADCLVPAHHLMTASDGQEALDMCMQTTPDMVITDVMMPRMDGMELCGHIKTERATSHIPVIMLTARSDLASKTEGLQMGADVYLGKPFETGELLAYVDSLLVNRRRIQGALAALVGGDATALHIHANLIIDQADLSEVERQFLSDTMECLAGGYPDPSFTVDALADGVHLSARQFRRKIEALTGRPPGDLLREYRLERARELIERGAGTMKEIGYTVGFRSESGFRKAFQIYFGSAPSDWKA